MSFWPFRGSRRKRSDPTVETSWHARKSLVRVGRFTYGHEKMQILEWEEGAGLTIGSFCSIARDVTIFLGGNHRSDWATTFPFGHIFQEELGVWNISGHPSTNGDVIIGHDVWIGSGATILSGIKIGNGAIIAANALVVSDVPAYTIVGGNPARPLRTRFSPNLVVDLEKLAWWDLPLDVIKQIIPSLCSAPAPEAIKSLIASYRSETAA